MELTEQENEQLQELLNKIAKGRNINLDIESDFLIDSFYSDITTSIETFLEHIKTQ
jgi:hypothetical protein